MNIAGSRIQPIMMLQHPAYRTQLEVLRSALPNRLDPVRPANRIEHERWGPDSMPTTISRYVDRLSLLRSKYGIAYVSGTIRPRMFPMLRQARRFYLDIDDPLSLSRRGGRNNLNSPELRSDALRLARLLEGGHLSFWTDTQLRSFLANFQSDEAAELLEMRRVSVLPPAIRPQVGVSGVGQSETLRCLCVATGKFWHKGVPDAIAAVDRLAETAGDVSLTIVGGSIPGPWQEFVAARPHFNLLSQVSRQALDSLFRTHDLLLFPSHHDSYGWVVIEAKSYGIPAIVTGFYCRSEIVTDGHDGVVVEDPFSHPFLPLGPDPYAGSHLRVRDHGGRIAASPLIENYIENLTAAIGEVAGDRSKLKSFGAAALAEVQSGSRFGTATRLARLMPHLG